MNSTASTTRPGAEALSLLIASLLLLPQAAITSCASEPAPPGGHRVIEWSGLKWRVKDSAGRRVGPGVNYFSGDPQRNVFIDAQGRLHLRIARIPDPEGGVRWTCAEVFSEKALGYGTYRWQVDSPIAVDPRVVFGLFTWDDTSEAEAHREIDVELISTWGQTNTLLNAQFVLQPFDLKGHLSRFSVPTGGAATSSIHSFKWLPDRIDYLSLAGRDAKTRAPAAILHSWTYRGSGIPHPGKEQVRINLWLLKPPGPTEPEPEVILSRFEHLPP